MAFFALEAHYYDGGLRIETFPESNTSSIKPNSEKVIIDSPNDLKNSEVYYELSFFKDGTNPDFLWLSCFLKSTDRQFGDRSNYVSVGIWLSNHVVTECKSLLRSLHEAASQLKKDGMTTALRSNLQQFSAIVTSRYTMQRDKFPPIYSGVSAATNLVPHLKIFNLDSSSGNTLEHIESVIMNFQLSTKTNFQNSRLVFRIASDSGSVEKSELLPPNKYLMQMITDIPRVMAETVSSLSSLNADYLKVRSEKDKLLTQIELLKREVLKITEEKAALLDSVAQLQKLPYTIINVQLKEIAQQIEKARHENLNFFKRLVEISPASADFPLEDYEKSNGHQQKNPAVFYLGLATAVIIIILFALFALPRVLETAFQGQASSSSLSAPQPVPKQPESSVSSTLPEKTLVNSPPSPISGNAEPFYSTQSKRNGEQGKVVLRVLVKTDGSVGDVEVKVSSGFQRLDKSAVGAVRSWRFKPAMHDGKVIDDWYEATVPFNLEK
jgi:TonB family protein